MKNEYLTKTKVNYSIDKNILIEFNEISKKKAINKSKLIELFIKDWNDKNR